MKKSIRIFIICLLVTGCRNNTTHPVDFYYWKANVSIGEVEQNYFNSLKCTNLYIRFFDVDRQGSEITPISKIQPFDSKVLNANYVPVIFITNRTFSNISEPQIETLAERIIELVEKICKKNALPSPSEIQIDCDWTETTRIAYFKFLELLEDFSRKQVSCTLRLHQVKFREKTGIPPVSKGYLMCYATSDPKDESDRNSILDIDLLKEYTANINDYPVDFDVALPVFSWAIATNHLGKIRLINNVTSADLDSISFKQTGDHTFEITEDLFFQGIYLNKGFTLKLESISPGLLQEARQYLDKKIKKPYHIVYYHLDKPFLNQYSIKELR